MATVKTRLTKPLVDGIDATRPWVGWSDKGPVLGTLDSNQREWFVLDTEVPGLYVRVFANGHKAYGLRQRMGGNAKRRSIGDTRTVSLTDARKKARVWLGLMADGYDPVQVIRQNERAAAEQDAAQRDTFGLLFGIYAKERATAGRPRTVQDREQVVRWLAASPLWKVPMVDLSVKDVSQTFLPLFMYAVGKSDAQPAWGPRGVAGKGRKVSEGARRPLASTTRCFRYCRAAWLYVAKRSFPDGIPTNPFDLFRESYRFETPEPHRPHLDTQQSTGQQWLKALFAMRSGRVPSRAAIADYTLCCLLWGTRKTETALLEWSMVKWEDECIEFPAAIVKTKQAFALPMTPFTRQLLLERQAANRAWHDRIAKRQASAQQGENALPRHPSPFVFPSRYEGKTITMPYKALAELARLAGSPTVITLHALRRTVATETALLSDFNAALVSRQLNHTKLGGGAGGATVGYIREAARTLRPIMERREQALLAMVGMAKPAETTAQNSAVDLEAMIRAVRADPSLFTALAKGMMQTS